MAAASAIHPVVQQVGDECDHLALRLLGDVGQHQEPVVDAADLLVGDDAQDRRGGHLAQLRVDRAEHRVRRPSRSRRRPARSACRRSSRSAARTRSPWPGGRAPRGRSARQPAPARPGVCSTRSMGRSSGVSRIARSTASESSMSMKRTSGTPNSPICSCRWMIVITWLPRCCCSARQPSRPRRHHRALPHQRSDHGQEDEHQEAEYHPDHGLTLLYDLAPMDLAIAIGQGLGLAVAAGFFATAPLAVAASVAAPGFADGSLGWADDPLTVAPCGRWPASSVPADAVWPGAQAGARLLRRGGRRWPRVRARGRRPVAVRGPGGRRRGRRCRWR